MTAESSPPSHGKHWSILVVIFRWLNTILSHGCLGALGGTHFTDRAAGTRHQTNTTVCELFTKVYDWSPVFFPVMFVNYNSMQDCKYRSENDREMRAFTCYMFSQNSSVLFMLNVVPHELFAHVTKNGVHIATQNEVAHSQSKISPAPRWHHVCQLEDTSSINQPLLMSVKKHANRMRHSHGSIGVNAVVFLLNILHLCLIHMLDLLNSLCL